MLFAFLSLYFLRWY